MNHIPDDRGAEMLALADEFEAGTAKAVATGYEEFGPEFQRKRKLLVDALRSAALPKQADSTCYLERSAVRKILIGKPDESLYITELVLSEIDALPIFTAADLRAPKQADPSREAERIVAEFEDIFGDITATERSWLTDKISTRLAAKPVNDGVREGLQRIIEIDQRADKTTTEIDPAGNTYSVGMVDGPCARIARGLLAPSPGERP